MKEMERDAEDTQGETLHGSTGAMEREVYKVL